jgi:two-component system OmpR family sensor kinase
MSLRARLLLGMAAIAVVLTVSAGVITRSTRDHLIHQVDEQLAAVGPRLVEGPLGQDQAGGTGPTPRLSELYVGHVDAAGQLTTILAPDLQDTEAPTPHLEATDVVALRNGTIVTVDSDGDIRYRMVARRGGRLGGITVLGLSLEDVDATVQRLVTVETVAVVSILAVLGLVTWWVMRLGVRPLRRMTDAATAIAAGDLSLRVPEAAPGTEAGELSAALNAMLGHIDGAFDERTAAEARLRQFIADASHELRTPVTTIRGYAELYRAGALDAEDELGEAMRRTEQEAIRMGTLVDDLLLLARLDQGRPLETATVELGTLAQDAVRDALAVAPHRDVRAVVDEAVTVTGDEARLRQVVANLVGNALVHAPDAAVEVRVRSEGDAAVIEVADRGPGMEPADAARAFERFYRADASRSRHHGGSGLGLSIVEATVRAHGGTATITSTPGHGTTVAITLPRPTPIA